MVGDRVGMTREVLVVEADDEDVLRRQPFRAHPDTKDLKRSTRQGYESIIEGHLIPELGSLQLPAVDVAQLDRHLTVARGGDPAELAQAEQALAAGDGQRSAGAVKNAITLYEDALAKAESA